MQKFLFLILILIENMVFSQNNVTIQYTLKIQEPASHIFEVDILFSNIHENYLDVKLPVWRPGRYLIFDFSSGVFDFNAFNVDSAKLKWKKIDKATWRIELNSNNSIRINYKVYANEFNFRTRGLDENHAFVDGTAVFMYSEKYKDNPLTLEIKPYKDWHVYPKK
jgi:predicted metalloprotease with PDZ domain